VDFPSQLGVGLELQFLLLEVVIGLRLLECGLPILADHHEGRQEDRLERDHQGQRRPWTVLEEQHPQGEDRGVDPHEAHGSRESRDLVGNSQLETRVAFARLVDYRGVVYFGALEEPMRYQPAGSGTK